MSKSGWLNDFEAEKDDVFDENLAFNEQHSVETTAIIAVKNTNFVVHPPFFEVYQLIKVLCEIE